VVAAAKAAGAARPGDPVLGDAQKRVLHGVTGFAAPGTFTAICGPSGAGKTSLMRILSRRLGGGGKNQALRGTILVNGQEVTDETFRDAAGFVAQEDVLMGSLTVRETFAFAAKLRANAAPGGEAEMMQRAEKLIGELGLTSCANTFVGYTGAAAANSGIKRGISGGERKRVSIGLELLEQPEVILADEPTSGLDAFAANSVCLHLAKLAREGKTVIATLHQPSQAMFHMFDRLIILGEGRVVYQGTAAEAPAYYASIGYPVPRGRNPTDHFIKVMFLSHGGRGNGKGKGRGSGKGKGEDGEGGDGGADYPEIEGGAQQLENADPLQIRHLAGLFPGKEKPPRAPPALSAKVRTGQVSWMTQFTVCFSRSMRNQLREPIMGVARFMQAIVLGLIFGVTYFDISSDQLGATDRAGALFFGLVTQAFGAMNGPLFVFGPERGVYYRETSSGLYNTLPYFLAKVIAELPINILAPFVFASIIYPMMGLRSGFEAFFVFLGILIILCQIPYAVGLVIAVAAKDQAVALNLQPLVMLPVMLLAGFYLSIDSIPVWIRWLGHTSFIRYGMRAASVNEFAGATFTCSQRDLDAGSRCTIQTGEQQLALLGFDGAEIWEDCAIMLGMWAGLLILAYIFLRCSKKQ
jgi:ABC-type multidrug transport system ATPase subunit